jgi:hypothetical protein
MGKVSFEYVGTSQTRVSDQSPAAAATVVLVGRSRPLAALVTLTLVAAFVSALCGCVATKYQLAGHRTPPAELLNRPFPPSGSLEASLLTLVTYHGPGSWKREALWDEYVVALHNGSERPIAVGSATLTDSAGIVAAAGVDPWALEKQSRVLEKRYRTEGEAFVRAAGPGALIVGAGAAAAAATTTAGAWTFVAPAAVGASLAALTILPVYYGTVVIIDHHNKQRVMTEFTRRRLPLPLTLAPGETRIGSLFYPMIRSPGALVLRCSTESGSPETALPLDFLSGLHVPAEPANTGGAKYATRQ